MSALGDSVVANLREEEPGRKLDIVVDPNMHVDADPKLLRVALENLLGNAAKFTSKVEHPTIHFGYDPGQKAFFVRDNGAGFDMYYKGQALQRLLIACTATRISRDPASVLPPLRA